MPFVLYRSCLLVDETLGYTPRSSVDGIMAPASAMDRGLEKLGEWLFRAAATSGLTIVPRPVDRKNPKGIEATGYVRVEGSQTA